MRLLIFASLLAPSLVFAQDDKRDVLNPDQLAEKEIKLEVQRTAPSSVTLPFTSIKIIDSRSDTSKIGYLFGGGIGIKRKFRKMALQGGISNAIEKYYNEYYTASFTQNDFELLIVMKRFWISGNAKSNKRIEVASSVGGNNSLYCKWEYYLGKNGSYLPVKRLDTVIYFDENVVKYIDEEFSERRQSYLKFGLKALVEILDYSNAIDQFNKQPKKTFAAIVEYNNRVNAIPVLQDGEFKKGVYLSFEEFKNNEPSIRDFREKKTRYRLTNSEQYLENTNGETISNYWGYSDGKEFRYGMLGNEKIYRIQNTFCFFIKVEGYMINTDNEGFSGQGSGISTTSKSKYKIWVPYQLDMETGEIY